MASEMNTMSNNKNPLLPRELVEYFEKVMSSGRVYLNLALVMYFVVSFIISGGILYCIYMFCPELLNFTGSLWEGFSVTFVPAAVSASVAILLCRKFTCWRLSKAGVKVETLPFFIPDWGLGLFRKWQIEQLKERIHFGVLDSAQKKSALDSYVSHTKEKIESISPIVNPAIIIALFAPLYAVLLDKVFSSNTAEEHLFLLTLLVLFCLVGLWLFLVVIGGLVALFNRKRDTYKELLEILNEIQFELEVATKENNRYVSKMSVRKSCIRRVGEY